jgi:hypothetical protein
MRLARLLPRVKWIPVQAAAASTGTAMAPINA